MPAHKAVVWAAFLFSLSLAPTLCLPEFPLNEIEMFTHHLAERLFLSFSRFFLTIFQQFFHFMHNVCFFFVSSSGFLCAFMRANGKYFFSNIIPNIFFCCFFLFAIKFELLNYVPSFRHSLDAVYLRYPTHRHQINYTSLIANLISERSNTFQTRIFVFSTIAFRALYRFTIEFISEWCIIFR